MLNMRKGLGAAPKHRLSDAPAVPLPATKKELGIDSPPEEKLAALKSAADCCDSDLTHLICRDENDKLLTVSVHAKGEHAEALLRWLESPEIKDL